jgi:hypothetical protein
MTKHKHSLKRCRALVSRKIRKLKKEGKPKKQRLAIALSIAKRKGCRLRRKR